MTQADSVHSTPRTNSPAALKRSYLLSTAIRLAVHA